MKRIKSIMWIRIDCLQTLIQDNKITKLISTHLLKVVTKPYKLATFFRFRLKNDSLGGKKLLKFSG